jgi:hypothetical protein
MFKEIIAVYTENHTKYNGQADVIRLLPLGFKGLRTCESRLLKTVLTFGGNNM